MFGHRYFGGSYFGQNYFGQSQGIIPPPPTGTGAEWLIIARRRHTR